MKRDPALHDLSRDHFEALVEARRIRQAVEGAEGAAPVEEEARRFLSFWDNGVRMHFVEEEEVLLSIYSRHMPPTSDPDIRTMLDDHAWIRDGMDRLRRELEAGGDVTELLGSLGERLHDHARLEERVIFEQMQDLFSEDELAEAGRRSLAFRRENRGSEAIGPGRERLALPTEEDLA